MRKKLREVKPTNEMSLLRDVAEKVMGFEIMSWGEDLLTYRHVYDDDNWAEKIVPGYTTDLNTAMQVVDKLAEKGFWLKLTSPFIPGDEFKPKSPGMVEGWQRDRYCWFASFDHHGTVDTHPLWQASSGNPAEAICLAALKVVGYLEVRAEEVIDTLNDYCVADEPSHERLAEWVGE